MSDFYVPENAQLVTDESDDYVLESSQYTRVDGLGGHILDDGNVEVQRAPVMQAYSGRRRRRDNPDVPLCAEEKCKAYRSIKVDPYCYVHGKKRGMVPDADSD